MGIHDREAEVSWGFLLHVFHREESDNFTIVGIGKLQSHETFTFVDDRERPAFYVRLSSLESVRRFSESESMAIDRLDWRTMDGEPVASISHSRVSELRKFAQRLKEHGIATYEADLSPARRYLMDRGIRGGVCIRGPWQPGRDVDRVYRNPRIEPAPWEGSFSVLTMDIETDERASRVYAVSLVGTGPLPKHETEQVHLVGEPSDHDPTYAICYPNESALLDGFAQRVEEIDPDIITGWNVIDFDLSVLQRRFKALGKRPSLGRGQDRAWYRGADSWGASRMSICGRQVVDTMRLARAIPTRFEDYRLATVAQQCLGRTKTLEADDDESMPDVILRTMHSNRNAFCAYCLEDSRLVRDILASEGMLEMTVQRTLLTGLPLEGAWGSVAAFEFLYISQLHKKKIVAPTLGVDQPTGGGAPGGLVFRPKGGLHKNIFVFDFKSLYPSIMATFNIDPLAHVRASHGDSDSLLTAPNGASFVRDRGILPGILEQFFARRDEAKAADNELASATYKILMNAFYGVLASGSCRFASSRLAGAITEFGHYILRWTRDLLDKEGVKVLYGDTDSLFVDANLSANVENAAAFSRARELCAWVNEKLAGHVRDRYGVPSRLELEFEKYYRRFLLPASRGDETRGRSKGYAGLRVGPDGDELEIVGMEAVRRDWTDLAHDFQREMLDLVFHDEPPEKIEGCITAWIRTLRHGEKDQDLVYRKSLRKKLSAYTKSTPPHVKAARLLAKPRGLIHYVITTEGPQPIGHMTAPIDYDHYVQKQIRPIAQTIAQVCSISVDAIVTGQLDLFS